MTRGNVGLGGLTSAKHVGGLDKMLLSTGGTLAISSSFKVAKVDGTGSFEVSENET